MGVREVAADLVAEQDALDSLLAPLDDAAFGQPTPSEGWSVADQLGHLAYFDRTAAIAITDPEAFGVHLVEMLEAAKGRDDRDPDAVTLEAYRAMSPPELVEAWRTNRRQLAEAGATLDDGDRVIWYGPSMGATSFLTARLMETWAHGQDVLDAVGLTRAPTARLRHIAQLGVITRGWTYRNRGAEPPAEEVRVAVADPTGGPEWTWGADEAPCSVTGPAEDFCLVVTQRRHVDDTCLVTEGEAAREWMEQAQAFAGPPTDGPRPTAAAATTEAAT